MAVARDQAEASDNFSVTKTVAPIVPAEPTRRKLTGRVEFPAGVWMPAPGDEYEGHSIFISSIGWVSRGVAQQLAESLAGAVRELTLREVAAADQKAQESQR